MHSVVFADIDGTLIEPIRMVATAHEGVVAATDRLGRPVGFRTPRNDQLLKLLNVADRLVPVTGRSLEAYQRVRISFNSFAVLHHGALIIDLEGRECRAYTDEVERYINLSHQILDTAFDHAASEIASQGLPLRIYRQILNGRTVEVCVKHIDHAAAGLGSEPDAIAHYWSALPNVRIHRNGNNLALLPDMVTKKRAVQWVQVELLKKFGEMTTFGIGDSASDLGFMTVCDYWMIPDRSQIARRLESLIGGA